MTKQNEILKTIANKYYVFTERENVILRPEFRTLSIKLQNQIKEHLIERHKEKRVLGFKIYDDIRTWQNGVIFGVEFTDANYENMLLFLQNRQIAHYINGTWLPWVNKVLD